MPCGPFGYEVRYWPDVGYRFAHGDAAGILVPEESIANLLAAWVHLEGRVLSPQLRATLEGPVSAGDGAAGLAQWTAARSSFGPVPDIDPYQPLGEDANSSWQQILNCGDDAFGAAARTLADREKRHGRSSAALRRWLEAQDRVFAACGGRAPLPDEAEPGWPATERADRAYQRAAARFYNRDFEGAIAAFQEIAGDVSSPWRDLAPYLAARAWIRRSSIAGCPEEECLARAGELLRAQATTARDPSRRAAAAGLFEYVELRLDPEERARGLAALLTDSRPPDGFVAPSLPQALVDYRWLLHYARRRGDFDDLTAWVELIHHPPAAGAAEAARRWREHGGLPWLAAALALGPSREAGDAPGGDVLAAAAAVPDDSPAAIALGYHRARWLSVAGDRAGARQVLDHLLEREDLTAGDRAQARDLRSGVAADLDELVRHGLMVPTERGFVIDHGPLYGDDTVGGPSWLGPAALALADRTLPVRRLAELAEDERLPPPLRRHLATAGWVRAVLLHDDPAARRLAKGAAALAPELARDFADWEAARGGARDFAAAWLLLHNPGLRPALREAGGRRDGDGELDGMRDNWWCSGAAGSAYSSRSDPAPPPPWPAPERESALRELAALGAVPPAPRWLGEVVLPWARAHRADPRVPEALHLLVRSTRYGCPDVGYRNVSHAAFALLHERYPANQWAEKTPYWFD